jgi:hypothetical protein
MNGSINFGVLNREPIQVLGCLGDVLTGLRIAYAHDGDVVATEIVDLIGRMRVPPSSLICRDERVGYRGTDTDV